MAGSGLLGGLLEEIAAQPSEASLYSRSPRNWGEGTGSYTGVKRNGKIVYPALQQLQDDIAKALAGPQTNLTAAPERYLEPGGYFHGEGNVDPYLGGSYSALGGIQIFPSKYADGIRPLGSLIHETEHQRAFKQAWLGHDWLRPLTQAQEESLTNDYQKIARRFGLTGQPEPDEIAAELTRYEAMLPAGTRLQDSELGKQLLNTPERLYWWNAETRNPRPR